MKVKKVSNLKLLDMCATLIHVPRTNPISGWCKIICPIVRGVRFFEIWARLVLFLEIYYFYNYIWGSQSGRHRGHFEKRKERNDVKLMQLEEF